MISALAYLTSANLFIFKAIHIFYNLEEHRSLPRSVQESFVLSFTKQFKDFILHFEWDNLRIPAVTWIAAKKGGKPWRGASHAHIPLILHLKHLGPRSQLLIEFPCLHHFVTPQTNIF